MENKHFEDPFLKILPKLDLHGENSEVAVWLTKDSINMNQSMGNLKIAVIHGWHSNVLKNAIHKYLSTEKKVTKFYTYNSNNGITIIEITPKVEKL